jgi:hypothetical protein
MGRREIAMRQLLRAEALPIMIEWQAKADKIRY